MRSNFKLVDFQRSLESGINCLTVNESQFPTKVRHAGPFFYCDAKVRCEIAVAKSYSVGFVQSCDDIYLRHTYASGNYTQWEFPTPISDSITSTFPYYSTDKPVASGRLVQAGNGLARVQGPKLEADRERVNLSMNDNLNSNVQWWDPVPPNQCNYLESFPHTLTRIERKQKFTTLLIATQGDLTDHSTQHVLAKVTWQMHFVVDFDCTKPAGNRATATFGDGHAILLTQKAGRGPMIVPQACFVNSNANQVQQLVGYGPNGNKLKPKINW